MIRRTDRTARPSPRRGQTRMRVRRRGPEMLQLRTVLYENAVDSWFLEEVYSIPGGEKIKDCIQCGTCSGSCPVSWAMEETPRQAFAMVRAGMRNEVMERLTIWTCASCSP